jgi:hypothetical protein
MAPDAQISTHAPQSRQISGFITYRSVPSEMAATGQQSAQLPQLVQFSSIKYGIFILHAIIYIKSKKQSTKIMPCSEQVN